MGRTPHCSKDGLNRGAWTALEDKMLTDYVSIHGEGKWSNVAKITGLKRCGKSCRLRWLNYLRPDIKRGNISHDEEELIVRLHKLLGNRWSLIAGRLPGRTDNEIKNYWNSNLSKKAQDFQLVIPKLEKKEQLATPSPTATTPQHQREDLNPTNFETESGGTDEPLPDWPSGEENSAPEFFIDFNMEEFREILDPTKTINDCTNNNKNVRGTEGDAYTNESRSKEEVTEFAGGKFEEKYWDANECDQSELGGLELMSLVSNFLDAGVDWSGIPSSFNSHIIHPE